MRAQEAEEEEEVREEEVEEEVEEVTPEAAEVAPEVDPEEEVAQEEETETSDSPTLKFNLKKKNDFLGEIKYKNEISLSLKLFDECFLNTQKI